MLKDTRMRRTKLRILGLVAVLLLAGGVGGAWAQGTVTEEAEQQIAMEINGLRGAGPELRRERTPSAHTLYMCVLIQCNWQVQIHNR